MNPPPEAGRLPFAYLTTTGRSSGRPRRIELWFGLDDRGRAFFLSGGGRRSHWVRNLEMAPDVTLEVAGVVYPGRASVIADGPDDALARRLLAAKYEGWSEGRRMSGWARESLAVVVDFEQA